MKSHVQLKLLAASLLLAFSATAAASDFSTSAPPSVTSNYDVSSLQNDKTYSGIIITYKDGSVERSNAGAAVQNVGVAVTRAKRALNGGGASFNTSSNQAVTVHYARKLAAGSDLVRTARPLTSVEASALIKQIAADPSVAFVEPEFMLQAVDTVAPADAATFITPDDPYYGKYQWDYLTATGANFFDSSLNANVANWGGANIENAWSLADGTGVVIASLDTGVTQHPDLDLTLADDGYDFISSASVSGRSSDGRVSGGWDTGDWTTAGQCGIGKAATNSSWHGTHVFGTAGGEITNNTTGMAGTAFNAQVLPVRVLGHCGGSNADIADAITWASGGSVSGVPDNTHPAKVISLSLGGAGTCSSTSVLGKAITGAIGRGAAVIVAAGNNNANVSGYSPASCAGVVAVAATGITSTRAYYSNYGAGITLAAPGGGVYKNDASSGTQTNSGFIWSTINAGTTTPTTATYGGMAGTSQATPHVAGVVALMQSYRLALGKALLSSSQVTSVLKSTAAVPHVTPSTSKPIGAGLLDAYKAVQTAGSQP
jgi:serine protease